MESFIAKVIEAYRITIPKEIREKLGLKEGDYVEASILRKIERTNQEIVQKASVVQ